MNAHRTRIHPAYEANQFRVGRHRRGWPIIVSPQKGDSWPSITFSVCLWHKLLVSESTQCISVFYSQLLPIPFDPLWKITTSAGVSHCPEDLTFENVDEGSSRLIIYSAVLPHHCHA